MEDKEYWNNFVEINKEVYSCYNADDLNLQIINSINSGKSILALGCGAGREVKLLVEKGNKVIAIDISDKMIKKSKLLEPNAEHICVDAVKYAEENKNTPKFDYILGLYNLFSYIKKKDRKEFIKNLTSMLNKDGQIIFVVTYIERWQDIIKSFIAVMYSEWEEWGDVYDRKNYYKSHLFTKAQLKKLFKEYKYTLKGKVIMISGLI